MVEKKSKSPSHLNTIRRLTAFSSQEWYSARGRQRLKNTASYTTFRGNASGWREQHRESDTVDEGNRGSDIMLPAIHARSASGDLAALLTGLFLILLSKSLSRHCRLDESFRSGGMPSSVKKPSKVEKAGKALVLDTSGSLSWLQLFAKVVPGRLSIV